MSKKEKRSKVEKLLTKKQSCLSNHEQTVRMHQFLDCFVLCEIACKAVLEMYKKNNKTFTSKNNLRLDMKEIPAALKYAGYNIDSDILNSIFSGSGKYRKRGTMSARLLRNAVIHNLSEPDIKEICNRYEHLYNTMNIFLSHFGASGQQEQNTQKPTPLNKAA